MLDTGCLIIYQNPVSSIQLIHPTEIALHIGPYALYLAPFFYGLQVTRQAPVGFSRA